MFKHTSITISFFALIFFAQIGLAEVPLKSIEIAKSGLEKQYLEESLPLNLKVTQNCMFGDFDAIKQDMLYSDEKKLLVSLESLATGEEVVVEALSKLSNPVKVKSNERLGDVMSEFDEFFKILNNFGEELVLDKPITNKDPELYVIKVCKDSTSQNSCKNKPYISLLEVVEQYKNPGRSFKPEDRIYYAQLVSINQEKISMLADAISEDNQAKVESTFVNANVLGAGALSNVISGLVKVRSLPLNIHNNKLQIVLPSFDPIKCGQETK